MFVSHRTAHAFRPASQYYRYELTFCFGTAASLRIQQYIYCSQRYL